MITIPAIEVDSDELPLAPKSVLKNRQSIETIITNLSKRVPDRLLERREAPGGKVLVYLPWYQAVKIMNHYCVWEYALSFGQLGSQRYEERTKKGWQGKPDTIKTVQLGASVAIKATVYIHCLEGRLGRDAIGEELLESDAHGGPAKTCESEVLRRACSKWGLMLSAYAGEYDKI